VLDLKGIEYSRIRVTTEGVGTLHFDQFEIWRLGDAGWQNIARRRSTWQSSTWGTAHGPETAVNGLISGDAGPHTHHEPHPTWELDFGTMEACDFLVLFNRIRYHADRLANLQIYGHGTDGWALLWEQSSESGIHQWATTLLHQLDERLACQIENSIGPQTRLASPRDKERAQQTARFFSHLEHLKNLRRLVGSTQATYDHSSQSNPLVRDAIRSGLRACLPTGLVTDDNDVMLFDVARYVQLHVRARTIGSRQTPASSTSFGFDFFAHERVGPDRTVPLQTQVFDYISCRTTTTFVQDTLENGLALTVRANELPNVKWELWGETEDGNLALLYDNCAATRAIFQLQYLLEPHIHPFEDMVLGSRALELEGKYTSAWMFSMYFPTAKPSEGELDDYLDQIEYLSYLDESRPAKSRTKHGYKSTFRFRSKPAFASGIQVVTETIAKGGFTAVPFYGTLLGFLRDGSLIDHDDDGDLLLLSDATSKEEMLEVRENLKQWLADNTDWTIYPGDSLPGLNCSVSFPQPNKRTADDPLSPDGQDTELVHVDLFPTWLAGDARMVLHEQRGGFVPMPAELFDAEREISVEGADFRIPAKSEDLLELTYGDWRTPLRSYRLNLSHQT